jgi:DNA polymerase elongation subunit (family B)
LLSRILEALISIRKQYKKSKDKVTARCCTCAEIITFAARSYLRIIILVARSCGYNVIYRNINLIFVKVKGKNKRLCIERGNVVEEKIVKQVKETAFKNVVADIKENYILIVITSKKKYKAVM